MQERDVGSRSGIIDLLRTKNQQDKKNPSSASSGVLSNHSIAMKSILAGSNLNQPTISQIAASSLGSSYFHFPNILPHNPLLLQQPGHSFLPSSVARLQPSLTANQIDLLLLNSLQGQRDGLLGRSNNLSMLSARSIGAMGLTPAIGAMGLSSTLPFTSGIDAAIPAIAKEAHPSLMMAELQNNNPKMRDMLSTRSETFPEKLHRLLLDVEYEGNTGIISFTPDGLTFLIHKPREFFEKIVPKYFNQSHLSSFKRQLNLYGFEVIASGASKGAYFHQDFQRMRPQLCRLIHRRKQKWRIPESVPESKT
jgi:hypothetical protein